MGESKEIKLIRERIAALEAIKVSGERIAALEAKVAANEVATNRAVQVGEKALERSDIVLTKRFEAANEVRQAMKDQTLSFVTRVELYWAVGAVLALLGLVLRLK